MAYRKQYLKIYKECKTCSKGFYPWASSPQQIYCSRHCVRHTQEHKDKVRQAMLGRAILWKDKIGASNKITYKDERLRRLVSERHKGPNSKWWKGGITHKNYTERQKIMNSFEYRDWRRKVFERDNHTCVICLATSGEGKTIILNADHIYPFSKYPSVRFKLENGRTLCVDCHRKTDTYGRPKILSKLY